MDADKIRRDFTILAQEGGPFVYLDTGATTHKPPAVM